MKKEQKTAWHRESADRLVACALSEHPQTLIHLRRAADWLKVLDPNPEEALLIAALLHDIERAAPAPNPYISGAWCGEKFLSHHQRVGAKMAKELLESAGASRMLVKHVGVLVGSHETGGSVESNLLKDADSISFFENNIEHFLTEGVLTRGEDKVREKFNWMFERISSVQARELARPFYQEALEELKRQNGHQSA